MRVNNSNLPKAELEKRSTNNLW